MQQKAPIHVSSHLFFRKFHSSGAGNHIAWNGNSPVFAGIYHSSGAGSEAAWDVIRACFSTCCAAPEQGDMCLECKSFVYLPTF
ncbi:hypothetical protein HMPREF1981_01053 [Bacteroides pyogenes F0041]|uniref:Uncharacterized protein n=1 Tax=Bacteroides pyogenes F0041 TaxID=1321819 RepID=U2E1U6_9BACE|nr:hypothetical protein HMPREF1981_01053 [Bacteroides pyogenes F0041]